MAEDFVEDNMAVRKILNKVEAEYARKELAEFRPICMSCVARDNLSGKGQEFEAYEMARKSYVRTKDRRTVKPPIQFIGRDYDYECKVGHGHTLFVDAERLPAFEALLKEPKKVKA